jgi:beta-glucosidase
VIQSGNPILMPWKDKVAAIVEAWYPGEAGGRAIGNVLFGKVDPSGKLPFTFPARDEDTPTWGATGAVSKDPVYSEKLNIGYRWYDAKKLAPLFEFGYGLSYTNFTYSDRCSVPSGNLSVLVSPGWRRVRSNPLSSRTGRDAEP